MGFQQCGASMCLSINDLDSESYGVKLCCSQKLTFFGCLLEYTKISWDFPNQSCFILKSSSDPCFSVCLGFSVGFWFGVELEQPTGKHDGSVFGVRYFSCLPKYGVFAPPSRVQR